MSLKSFISRSRALFPTWSVLALMLITVSACRQSALPTATPSDEFTMTVETLTDVRAGKTTLIVTLRDKANQPVEGAVIEVVGNMSHAGMQPSLGAATAGTNGRYEVPFDWTMGGDWVLTVSATLPDGRTLRKDFPVVVSAS